jgi:hypothetical protein
MHRGRVLRQHFKTGIGQQFVPFRNCQRTNADVDLIG